MNVWLWWQQYDAGIVCTHFCIIFSQVIPGDFCSYYNIATLRNRGCVRHTSPLSNVLRLCVTMQDDGEVLRSA